MITVLLAATCLTGCSRDLLKKAQQYELSGNDASALLAYQAALDRTSELNPRRRAEILMRMGDCLYRLERYPEAFTTFQKAAEADHQNSLAHLRMGEMLLSAGSADGAREQAMIVLSRMASSTDALALLGAAWAAADKPAMAQAAYEQVLEADPKRVTAAVALADIYNREDDVAKAREVLTKAAAAQPLSSLPWLAKARLEEQEANSTEAEAAYRRAVATEDTPDTNLRLAQFLQRSARITESEQVLRHVDAQRRDYPVALADFQFASGRPGEALEQYRKAFEAAATASSTKKASSDGTSNDATTNHASVASRIIEAEISAALRQSGNKKTSALAAVRSRLEAFRPLLDPATAAILGAELALADNNLVVAELLSNNAMELSPDSASAHYIRGLVQAALGNEDDAQTAWMDSLDKDEHFLPAHLALAEAALKRGDAEMADEHARAAVREDPGNFRAVMLFARALLLQKKPTMAGVMARRAAELDPVSAEPSIILGEVSLKLDSPGTALLNFQRAVTSQPESEEAINGLLRVYRRGTLSYSSLRKMERVAQNPPVSGTLLEIVGRLFAERGWYSEAIGALTKAVRADPSRTAAARVLAQLQMATGDVSEAAKAAASAGTAQEPLLRGYESESKGDWQEAISQYERAIKQGDQSGVAANNLAWLYATHNVNLERALELAESAVKFIPEDPGVIDTLGYVYLRRRQYSLAVKTLETAAHLSLRDNQSVDYRLAMQIRNHLREAYYSAGQTEAGLELAQNRGPFALK